MNWQMNIFILHYQDDETTNACIASLLPQLGEDYTRRLTVVDDGSPTAYRCPFSPEDVFNYRLEKNLFMIPAFALAMRTFPAEVYGLLNNDLRCNLGMVDTINDCFDDPDVGIVAPGSSDAGTGILYVPGPGAWGNVETTQVDNHCMFINHALVEDIGYPEVDGHTNLFCWAWNKYYCWQARQAGYKVIAARNAYVEHLHRGGYNAEADKAGQAWLKARLGDRWMEAW